MTTKSWTVKSCTYMLNMYVQDFPTSLSQDFPIAIQIGGIGGLAPDRRSDLARLGLRAVLGGSLATFMTATIAGVLTSL